MDYNNMNEGFIISDSFINMEYHTPKHSIFDIYNIGSWNIDVIKKFDKITKFELILYFNQLIKFCPWLYLKQAWWSTEKNSSIFHNDLDYINFNIDILKKENVNEELKWDIATYYCGLNLIYNQNSVKLNNKSEVIIYISFYDDNILGFSIDFKVDLFFENPSRQPGVLLNREMINYNRFLLERSLRQIEESGIFQISAFESELHSDNIIKYGFK